VTLGRGSVLLVVGEDVTIRKYLITVYVQGGGHPDFSSVLVMLRARLPLPANHSSLNTTSGRGQFRISFSLSAICANGAMDLWYREREEDRRADAVSQEQLVYPHAYEHTRAGSWSESSAGSLYTVQLFR